jgi:hypothetical protein
MLLLLQMNLLILQEPYKKVLLRQQWVKHIEKNRLTLDFPSLETTTLVFLNSI